MNNRTLNLMSHASFALTLLALTLLAPRITMAQTVASTSGDLTVLTSAPANVANPSGTQSNTNAFGFQEQQNYTLTQNLNVDVTKSGTYATDASLTPGTVAAGTTVDSYMVYSNPVTGLPAKSYSGSVTLSNNILGVIVLTDGLNDSDYLGATGTIYPGQKGTSAIDRGLELTGDQDSVDVSITGNTISYNFLTSDAEDEIRIITAAPMATPEPSSLAAFGLGALALGGILVAARRKKSSMTLA